MKLLLSLLLLAAPAFAADTGSLSGGGRGQLCGGELLDTLIANSVPYVPQQDPAYKNIVYPVLQRIRECVPFLHEDMIAALSKPWRRVKCPLRADGGPAGHTAYETTTAAFQDRMSVNLDDAAMKQLEGSAKEPERARLILHELLQGIRVQKNLLAGKGETAFEDAAVINFSNDLLGSGKGMACGKLKELAGGYIHSEYATRDELKVWGQLPEDARDLLLRRCENGEKVAPASELSGTRRMNLGFFERAGSPRNEFFQKNHYHFLGVPDLPEEALMLDGVYRNQARYGLRKSAGFYDLPPTLVYDSKEMCRRAKLPPIDAPVDHREPDPQGAPEPVKGEPGFSKPAP